MLGPVIFWVHLRNSGITYLVSHHRVSISCGTFLPFSSTCPIFSSLPGFLPTCSFCFLKLHLTQCAVASPSASSSQISQLQLSLLTCLILLVFSVRGGKKPSKETWIDPAYFKSCCSPQIKLGLAVWRPGAHLGPISCFSISETKMNSVSFSKSFCSTEALEEER